MNKKAFIRMQIKELIPIFIAIFISLAAVFWFTILGSNTLPTVFQNGEQTSINYYTANPPLAAIIIPSFLAALVLPFAAFSYQTNHIRADFFYQIPLKERELRRIRLLTYFILLEIIVSVVYWIGILFLFSRQVSENAASSFWKDTPYFYNYAWFLLYWLYLLVALGLHFFVSSYFISLGTRVIDSMIYLAIGHVVLVLWFGGVMRLLDTWTGISYSSSSNEVARAFSQFEMAWFNQSWLEPILQTIAIFTPLANNIKPNFTDAYITARVLSSVCYVLIGAGCIVAMMLSKDPSGERAGHPGARNLYISFYPHVFAVVIGLYLANMIARTSVVMVYTGFLSFILWGVAYYFLLVLVKAGFRFRAKTWIAYGSVLGGILFLTILSRVLLLYSQA